MKNVTAEQVNEAFENKVVKFDGCNLPLCKAELHQHILRTRHI